MSIQIKKVICLNCKKETSFKVLDKIYKCSNCGCNYFKIIYIYKQV